TGAQAVQDSAVRLTGPQPLLGQFPATTLATGPLAPGGSKSLEFIATIPQSPVLQQVELQVALVTGSGQPAAPSQTLPISIQSTAAVPEDVDHIPAATIGAQRPNDYLLAIGLSSYREQEIVARKYASLDAETVAAYFQTLGGFPQKNV